jgi:hypothetical protein
MKPYDVTFILTNGTKYDFMLAKSGEKKLWEVQRMYTIAPSLIKQKINMTVTAREDEMSLSGIRQLKRVAEILSNLDAMIDETENITLHGFDSIDYPVVIDKEGIRANTVIHEGERDPEYQVQVICWGVYN